jgi:hypothetical protein
MKILNSEFKRLWREGNDQGRGYAIGNEDMTPCQAAKDGGLENIQKIDPEGNVAGILAGDIIVVCNSNGPWAVTVGSIGLKWSLI